MTERIDCLVIGAGVVGLAVARQLALAGREVIVVEAETAIGLHTSTRNSGVIHAGFASTAPLKTQLCLRGKELLYRFCAEHGVAHRRIGKLLVAPTPAGEEGVEALTKTHRRAESVGLTDLRTISRAELREMESDVDALAAVLSPSSGIVDALDLMRALQGDIEDHAGAVAFDSPVVSGVARDNDIEITTGGASPMTVRCRAVVNCAGFNAQIVGASLAGLPRASVPERLLSKGSYFVLTGKSPFQHLIYPVHTHRHRSMHCTLDMGGQLRFGPDTEWVDQVDYRVDESRAPAFYEAIRQFWPSLPDGALAPGWAGLRPKTSRAPAGDLDFIIQGPETHGVRGLIHLYGIESPGLTSSLAIAEEVGRRLGAV